MQNQICKYIRYKDCNIYLHIRNAKFIGFIDFGDGIEEKVADSSLKECVDECKSIIDNRLDLW